MYKKESVGLFKHWDFALLDMICLQVAFCLAYYISGYGIDPYRIILYRNMAVFMEVANLVVLFSFATLKNVLKRGAYKNFVVTMEHGGILSLVCLFYLFAMQQGQNYSRLAFTLTIVLYIIITFLVREFWKYELRRKMTKGVGRKRSLFVITSSDIAEKVVKNIKQNNYAGFEMDGVILLDEQYARADRQLSPRREENAVNYRSNVKTIIEEDKIIRVDGEKIVYLQEKNENTSADKNAKQFDSRKKSQSYNDNKKQKIDGVDVITDVENIAKYIGMRWVDEVFVILSDKFTYPFELIEQLEQTGVVVHIHLAKISRVPGKKQFVENIGDYTVLTTSMNYATQRQLLAKRLMDIAGGLVGCILTGIVFLFVAPMIYIASPGPIFFTQERVGKNGKKFKMYKFRSMYMDAEARKAELMKDNKLGDGKMFKLDFDPRVIGNKILPNGKKKTGVGDFIRRTSLDEFPQFFNVLKGDMSLVGTRPPLFSETSLYELNHYARLVIKPGITGMWQVSGRSDITDFDEVVRLDKEYIENWSIGLDIKILFKTILVVFKKDGSM